MLSASDLVLSRSNGNILAGGYKINSLLLEGGHATTLNKKIDHKQQLAVPFGLSLLKQYTNNKINNVSTVNAGLIPANIYDKMLSNVSFNALGLPIKKQTRKHKNAKRKRNAKTRKAKIKRK